MPLPESRQLDFDEIPVIDIGRLLDRDSTEEVVQAIDIACTDVGFFYIVGHDFDMGLATRLLTAAGEFFNLPESDGILGSIPRCAATWLTELMGSVTNDDH